MISTTSYAKTLSRTSTYAAQFLERFFYSGKVMSIDVNYWRFFFFFSCGLQIIKLTFGGSKGRTLVFCWLSILTIMIQPWRWGKVRNFLFLHSLVDGFRCQYRILHLALHFTLTRDNKSQIFGAVNLSNGKFCSQYICISYFNQIWSNRFLWC